MNRTQTLIIAHRGASRAAPENTLAAFELAWGEGADGIEGDFRLTRDDQIVCLHDSSTLRMTGTDLCVAETTLAELRKLEIAAFRGSHETAGPSIIRSGASIQRIATLDEVLGIVPSAEKIFIELKSGPEIIPRLKGVLSNSPVNLAQVVVISFDSETLLEARRQIPAAKLLLLIDYAERAGESPALTTLDRVQAVREAQADGVGSQADRSVVDAPFVRSFHDVGLEFHVWTVNDPDLARYFRELGVDSLTTDHPGRMKEEVGRMKAEG